MDEKYKIGGENMKYVLPTYDKDQEQIYFSFYFADSKVWDFYHPKEDKDSGYEVEKSLAACQGVLMLVDSTQGIQAQTLSTFHSAQKHVWKID